MLFDVVDAVFGFFKIYFFYLVAAITYVLTLPFVTVIELLSSLGYTSYDYIVDLITSVYPMTLVYRIWSLLDSAQGYVLIILSSFIAYISSAMSYVSLANIPLGGKPKFDKKPTCLSRMIQYLCPTRDFILRGK